MLSLRPENPQPLTKGTLVEFRGLSQPELNGEVGTVDSVDYSECRYLAKMRDGHIKSVSHSFPHHALVDGSIFTQCASSCLFVFGNDPEADAHKMVALARAAPDFYAVIAPVAAHHNQERADFVPLHRV